VARRKAKQKTPHAAATGEFALTEPWFIEFFQRHVENDAHQTVPGKKFLERCPETVRQRMLAVLKAVAEAPPPRFSGGGYWEAMHDDMGGFYEIRVDGPQREHFRLFCLLERDGANVGLNGPSLVVITGMRKRFRTTFRERDYKAVRELGNEFKQRRPRSVLS
jgi:hypothetical protein